MAAPKFSILLLTDNPEQGVTLGNLIRPSFPIFFVARSEEEAIKIIVKERIDILLMGLSSLQANEACYLHLISAKEGIGSIIKRKFLLCGKEEIRDAFFICNKEIFDDYFITRPLYDPYHILIRMRFLKRLFKREAEGYSQACNPSDISITDLCDYFDKVVACEQTVEELGGESLNKLLETIASSVERLKQNIAADDSISETNHGKIASLINDYAEKDLAEGVKQQHAEAQQTLNYQLKDVADAARVKKRSATDPAPVDLTGVDVLLVEDDVETHEAISAVLVGHNCEVANASTAMEAVAMLNSVMPKVLLLDLTLPDMTPFFVISKLREKTQDTKVILLARPSDRTNVAECIHAGANGFLIKPVDHQVLLHKIADILK